MISPAQCRMARAALAIGVRELADLAGVSAMTVTRFENGHSQGYQYTLDKLQFALEKAGVVFVDENGEGAGVRLKKKAKTHEELTSKIADLHEVLPVIDNKAKPIPANAMKQLERARVKNEITKAKGKQAKLTTKGTKPKS